MKDGDLERLKTAAKPPFEMKPYHTYFHFSADWAEVVLPKKLDGSDKDQLTIQTAADSKKKMKAVLLTGDVNSETAQYSIISRIEATIVPADQQTHESIRRGKSPSSTQSSEGQQKFSLT
jgi:BioD-like phosphotransacetylase family protein